MSSSRLFLDWRNTNGKQNGEQPVQLKGYQIASQNLSIFCCERYFHDELIDVRKEANNQRGRDLYRALPSTKCMQVRTFNQ